jgi:hypothetical protein
MRYAEWLGHCFPVEVTFSREEGKKAIPPRAARGSDACVVRAPDRARGSGSGELASPRARFRTLGAARPPSEELVRGGEVLPRPRALGEGHRSPQSSSALELVRRGIESACKSSPGTEKSSSVPELVRPEAGPCISFAGLIPCSVRWASAFAETRRVTGRD